MSLSGSGWARIWALAACLAAVRLAAREAAGGRCPDAAWRPLVERWDTARAEMTAPVENLRLPLDYHANGRLKAALRASKAQLLAEGLLVAEGVRVELYDAAGGVEGTLTAEACLFDRGTKLGYCVGRVSLVRGADRLKGRDLYFSTEEQFIKILSDCEIRTTRIPVKMGRLL